MSIDASSRISSRLIISSPGLLTFGQDEVKGNTVTDTIFYDSDVQQMESIPPTAFHREIDLAIMQADKDGVFNRDRRFFIVWLF